MISSAPVSASRTASSTTRTSETAPAIVQPSAVATPAPKAIRGPYSASREATIRAKSCTDSSVVRRTLDKLCSSLADCEGSLSALQVRHERGRREAADRDGAPRDLVRVGKLGDDLCWDERCHLDLVNTGS